MTAKTIALYIFDGVQLLDVAGPCDVFHEANLQSGRVLYRIEIVADRLGPVTTSAGLQLRPTRTLSDIAQGVHTLLVAGTPAIEGLNMPDRQLRLLEAAAKKSVRYGSICTGAFLMARTGLMDRKRVTTHWAFAERLKEQFPAINVCAEEMFVKQGRLRSSAGVSAGIDLCLSLVEEDHGLELAARVSRQLVTTLRRHDSQAQFSSRDHLTLSGLSVLARVQEEVSKRLKENLGIQSLADHMGISARHLNRLFRKELKTTPAAWVENVRLEAAKKHLEQSLLSLKEIAFECGFTSVDSLRRVFLRKLGMTPTQYRRRHGWNG